MSGEAKFTGWRPGQIRHAGAFQLVEHDGQRGYVCEVQAPVKDGEFDEAERVRRVRLIAAAPDLYEAAVHAARTGTDLPDDMIAISGGAYRLLCAAVRKATGAQP